MPLISRKVKESARILLTLWICLCLLLAYAHFVEPNIITVREVEVRNDALARALGGLVAIQLTDLHLSAERRALALRIIREIHHLAPDLIFLTGDYVDWYSFHDDYDLAEEFLGQLDAPLGVYGVMGDSDYTFSRRQCGFCHDMNQPGTRRTSPVHFLRDARQPLLINGQEIVIAGIDISPEPKLAYFSADTLVDQRPTIVLSHSSVQFDQIASSKDVLMLSGDTHGGQVHLPDVAWRLWKRKPDARRMRGVFREGNKTLVVSSGIGTSDLDIRFGVPPEIVVLRFVSSRKEEQ